jgi:hypothetical protein
LLFPVSAFYCSGVALQILRAYLPPASGLDDVDFFEQMAAISFSEKELKILPLFSREFFVYEFSSIDCSSL